MAEWKDGDLPFDDAPRALLYRKVPLRDDDGDISRWIGCDIVEKDGVRYAYVQLNDEAYFELTASGLARSGTATYHWQTVRSYHREFEAQRGRFLPLDQGHYAKVAWLLDDPILRGQFEAYVVRS